MDDDFALRYVRIYAGVNSRVELVTIAPGLARGLIYLFVMVCSLFLMQYKCIFDLTFRSSSLMSYWVMNVV